MNLPSPIMLNPAFAICITCLSPDEWIDVAPNLMICMVCCTEHVAPDDLVQV